MITVLGGRRSGRLRYRPSLRGQGFFGVLVAALITYIRRWARGLTVGALALSTVAWSGTAAATPRLEVARADDGPGVNVGSRSTLHPGFALVTGFDSNVFSTAADEARGGQTGPAGAAFVLPTGWLGLGNRQFRDGMLMSPPERSGRAVDYYIGGIVGFRQYLSGRPNVLGQSRVSGGLQMRLAFLPGRRFSVHFDEDLFRYAQPSTYEAQAAFNFHRIDHNARLGFIGRPGGGRFSILGGLHNQFLWFENRGGSAELARGNRTVNGFVSELKWRFLPKSALFFHYGMDWTSYLTCPGSGRGCNEDNFAHRITGGFRGQILRRVTLNAVAGYGLGYYRADDNGPNFRSFIGDASVRYFPNPRAMLGLGVYRSFHDSLFGNFYVDTGARVTAQYEFKWRMVGTVGAWVAGRRYKGLPEPGIEICADRLCRYEGTGTEQLERRDTLFSVNMKVEQPLRRIFSVALSYDLAVDATDFRLIFQSINSDGGVSEVVDEGGFNRHVVMLIGAVRL